MSTKPDLSPFPKYYRAESHGEYWHLHCLHCTKVYQLHKNDTNLGNQLRLLDHARSHKKTKRSKKVNQ